MAHNCIIMCLQDVLQGSTVRIATCLAAPVAKGLYVIAIQGNALLGARKGGQETNAIKVILHSFISLQASFGNQGVYIYIFKRRFIILKFWLSIDYQVTYMGFFVVVLVFFFDLVYCQFVSRHKISGVRIVTRPFFVANLQC